MKNSFIADIFRGIAELLEIKGDNPFRIRAYLRAAENIDALKYDIEEFAASNRLEDLPGIGKDLALKIDEIIGSGKCRQYEDLKKLVPEGVVKMLEIPSVGPKTAKLFFDSLQIRSVDELKEAADAGTLLGLPGIKQKTVDNILKGIELLKKGKERMDLLTATTVSESFIDELKNIKEVSKILAAGSLRRMKETVKDIDILVASKNPKKVSDAFIALPGVKRVLARGETKSSVLTNDDIQADLRVLRPDSFGAALLYFTGSKNHNIKLRQLAIKLGLKINEYGVFDKKDRRLASKTEKEMYKALGLDYIEPQMREDSGEIEAALEHRLPRLLDLKDIRGDFHIHTDHSDGSGTIEEMAKEAIRLGYDYVCLADHSESLKVARGLDRKRLKAKKRELDKARAKLKNIKILFGSEVEIDSNGDLDYKDKDLSQFDIVIAAIHSGFKQAKDQLTKRIVKACKNKYVHIIAHPTGRLWPTREPYEIDLKEIFKVARETNTALEISAQPYRLDLCDASARLAKECGVRLAISTDSHDIRSMSYMKFGIGVARRAWLESRDVLNSLKTDALLKAIRK
ncbi:MAG: DNA polymerase/3'-5' exonuclease PolX [Candidatus Omnitrophota bacterium]